MKGGGKNADNICIQMSIWQNHFPLGFGCFRCRCKCLFSRNTIQRFISCQIKLFPVVLFIGLENEDAFFSASVLFIWYVFRQFLMLMNSTFSSFQHILTYYYYVARMFFSRSCRNLFQVKNLLSEKQIGNPFLENERTMRFYTRTPPNSSVYSGAKCRFSKIYASDFLRVYTCYMVRLVYVEKRG